jgi:hypothetical protein
MNACWSVFIADGYPAIRATMMIVRRSAPRTARASEPAFQPISPSPSTHSRNANGMRSVRMSSAAA